MNSSAIVVPEPPRGRPSTDSGVHRHGGFWVVSPHQRGYRDPGLLYRSVKSRIFRTRGSAIRAYAH